MIMLLYYIHNNIYIYVFIIQKQLVYRTSNVLKHNGSHESLRTSYSMSWFNNRTERNNITLYYMHMNGGVSYMIYE